jgi:hypothetical protein
LIIITSINMNIKLNSSSFAIALAVWLEFMVIVVWTFNSKLNQPKNLLNTPIKTSNFFKNKIYQQQQQRHYHFHKEYEPFNINYENHVHSYPKPSIKLFQNFVYKKDSKFLPKQIETTNGELILKTKSPQHISTTSTKRIKYLMKNVNSNNNNDFIKTNNEDHSTTITSNTNECSNLFEDCLCAYHQESNRYFLYCNSPVIEEIPNFENVYTNFYANSDGQLIFSRLDFTGSNIKQITKQDLRYIKLDILNKKVDTPTTTPTNNHNDHNNYNNTVDFFLNKLKTTMIPMYHLDFYNINDIEDGSFEEIVKSSINLSREILNMPLTNQNQKLYGDIGVDDILLKVINQFSN